MRLNRVERQHGKTREAVISASEGRIHEALAAFAEDGRLHITKTGNAAMKKLLSDWSHEGLARPRDNLIVCSSKNRHALNLHAQEPRRARGLLGERTTEVAGQLLHEGARVRVTRNAHRRGLRAGDERTLSRIGLGSRTATIRLDEGRFVRIPLHREQHLELAYAIPPHAAAHRTVRTTFNLADG